MRLFTLTVATTLSLLVSVASYANDTKQEIHDDFRRAELNQLSPDMGERNKKLTESLIKEQELSLKKKIREQNSKMTSQKSYVSSGATIEDVMPQVNSQIESINNEVGLKLSDKQKSDIASLMAEFIIDQQKERSNKGMEILKNTYKENIYSILNKEQKEQVDKYKSL